MARLFNSKLLGGTLLLTGTAMGGGLLALPLSMAQAGFLKGLGIMIACWVLMTMTALLTLEASLWLPPQANIISMSAALLNPVATSLAWLSYLLLFYSLLAAYIAGGADFFAQLARFYWPSLPAQPVAAILFTALLGSIVYQGMHWIDYLNRIFMITKLVLYGSLVFLILPHGTPAQWWEGDLNYWARSFGVLVTAFSYTNMIPSLRLYFGEDIRSLRMAIIIGSIIPLVCYVLWNMSIMGVIPLGGENGLVQLSQSPQPAHALINQLNQTVSHSLLPLLSNSFAYICVFTTFLTCSWALSDFLADGFKIIKNHSIQGNSLIYGATFIPPLLIALSFQGVFMKALHYAGIYCLILFVLIPTLMVWQGRYRLNYKTPPSYQVPGGKILLMGLGFIALTGIIYNFYLACSTYLH